ncbi:hypothetical protein KJ641_01110 [Patescibacteria group bacterium]|nr:hypothetical protein [Patescibacteria group bacterium]MBU1895454.1 hypothetical protein [Patescibacteria group bacterium]
MTINDWISLIGSFGLIGAGSIVGSLVTIIVSHFLEKNKLKTERQSNLQKEIYFKLQEEAAKMFEEINLSTRQVGEMKFWLQKRTFESKITNTPVTERISKLSSFQAYFPKEIIKKSNEVSVIFHKIVNLYFEIGKTGTLAEEKANELNDYLNQFSEEANALVRNILAELERNKKLIV